MNMETQGQVWKAVEGAAGCGHRCHSCSQGPAGSTQLVSPCVSPTGLCPEPGQAVPLWVLDRLNLMTRLSLVLVS